MIKYQIQERLLLYLKEIGISVNALENMCGFSGRYLKKMNFELPEKKIEQILTVLPNLNKEWLLTGYGDMRLGDEDTIRQNAIPVTKKGDSNFDSQKRAEIMSRLYEIIQKEGFSIREFEKETGVFRGTWDKTLKSGTEKAIYGWVSYILTKFPGYSYDWAIFGRGTMKYQEQTVAKESASKPIPLVEVLTEQLKSANLLIQEQTKQINCLLKILEIDK